MSANKRVVIGQVCKTKDGKGKYLKVYKDHVLRNGMFLNIKSPDEERKDAMASFEAGRIGEDLLNKILARVDEYPEYVVASISYTKED